MKKNYIIVLLFSAPFVASCGNEGSTIDQQAAETILVANMNAAMEVEAALDRVARVCMEEIGFDVHPSALEFPEDPSIDDLLGENVLTRPNLSLPPEEIYGIGLNSGVDTTFVEVNDAGEVRHLEDPGEFDSQSVEAQDEYFKAFYGTAEMETEVINLPDISEAERSGGGCLREAEDALSDGNYPDYLNHAGLSGAKGGTSWESDDRVVDARTEWSICMESSGYSYDKPLDVYLDLAMQVGDYQREALYADESQVSSLEEEFSEIASTVAEVDNACHRETGLQDVQEGVFWEYLINYVSDHEEEFYSFKERTDGMLELAQDIIESGQLPS